MTTTGASTPVAVAVTATGASTGGSSTSAGEGAAGGGGGAGPCPEGTIVCDGDTKQVCDGDGAFVAVEECAPGVCHPGLGCTGCAHDGG